MKKKSINEKNQKQMCATRKILRKGNDITFPDILLLPCLPAFCCVLCTSIKEKSGVVPYRNTN